MRATIIRRCAAVATATCATFALFAGSAAAAEDESDALTAILTAPAAVAPGDTTEIRYIVENVSGQATDGLLVNISLPQHVVILGDQPCQSTGTNDEGGELISCDFSSIVGTLEPGETFEGVTALQILSAAPEDIELGRLGALVTPLSEGVPTGDWTKLVGANVVWTTVSTVAGGWLSGFTGLFS
jgi:hypothetical protein